MNLSWASLDARDEDLLGAVALLLLVKASTTVVSRTFWG